MEPSLPYNKRPMPLATVARTLDLSLWCLISMERSQNISTIIMIRSLSCFEHSYLWLPQACSKQKRDSHENYQTDEGAGVTGCSCCGERCSFRETKYLDSPRP